MLTVLSVIGTRPEAIKMAPVVKELQRHRDHVKSLVCVTGQHREMLDQVLTLFEIQPDYDLDVMRPDQTLAHLTSLLITGLDAVVEQVMPDWVLGQGDTTSVLAAALVAYYRRVRFGHVEAGLRTGDKRRPFPEEINRRLADVMADVYFAPTERARRALLREGVQDQDICVSGNTVIDALLDVAGRPFDWATGPLANVPQGARIVLVTAHRRESFGEPFVEICLAIRDLAMMFDNENIHFVYPVHLNPNVRRPVFDKLSGLSNVSLVEPLDYLALVHLMKRSALILTDSGGIQEEAPSLGVPVLVMRDTTERPEGIEAGVVRLVGTDRLAIVEHAERLLFDPVQYASMVKSASPYGDGTASLRIVERLLCDRIG